MAITGTFRDAVSAGDIRGVRIMMKDSLLVDPSFNEFNEMNNLARSVSGLYEPHDKRDINEDTSTWNDGYMNKLMVQVVGNFSQKRIDHLKDVVRHLRPVASRQHQPAETRSTPTSSTKQPRRISYQEQKRQDERDGRIVYSRGTKIATGAVAGGVIGGAIASVAGATVLVGAAAGAVVIGSVVVVATNGESGG